MSKSILHAAVATPLTTLLTDGTAATGKSAAASNRAQAAAGTMILGLFAIPLGVAGLRRVAGAEDAAPGPTEAFFGVSAGIWIVLTAAYLASGIRRSGRFTADRKHAVHGPFTAYIPLIGGWQRGMGQHHPRSSDGSRAMAGNERHAQKRIPMAECTDRTELAPSPTAEATLFMLPCRTSPAAKTAGTLVSNGRGGRSSAAQVGPSLPGSSWTSVRM